MMSEKSPHHDNHRTWGHVMQQAGIERLLPQFTVVLRQQLLRHLHSRDSHRSNSTKKLKTFTLPNISKHMLSDVCTCNIFRPTSLKPRCSKRRMICPTRRRWTPSGLTAIRVCSLTSWTPGGTDRKAADVNHHPCLLPYQEPTWKRTRIDPNGPTVLQGNTRRAWLISVSRMTLNTSDIVCIWCVGCSLAEKGSCGHSRHELMNDCMRSIQYTRDSTRENVTLLVFLCKTFCTSKVQRLVNGLDPSWVWRKRFWFRTWTVSVPIRTVRARVWQIAHAAGRLFSSIADTHIHPSSLASVPLTYFQFMTPWVWQANVFSKWPC